MNNNSYNDINKEDNRAQARKLSEIGAVLYSVAATLMFMLGTLCMRTDGEGALCCFFIPVLYTIGSYLIVALLVQGRGALFIASALSSVLCGYVISENILHSALCLVVFVLAYAVFISTREKRFGFVGNICLSSVFYALCFMLMLCVLLYEKYSEVSMEMLLRAYESFTEVISAEPRAALQVIIETEGEEAARLAETYKSMLSTLDEMLDVMLYSVPSLFASICVICGFFSVFAIKKHRRMLQLTDTIGAFEITVFSAVFYIIAQLIILFIDPITPIGITLITISSPLELGLALSGVLFGMAWLKKNNKGRGYYVAAVAVLVIMPSMAVTILAYLGAYSTVLVYRFRRMLERAIESNRDDRHDNDDDDPND